MTGQRRLGFVAAAATLLAAAPLSAIFDQWTWLLECLIAVGLIAVAAAGARTLRAPVWAQVLAMTGALLLVLTWMFPSGDEFLAVLPGPDTFAWFGSLVSEAVVDMRGYGVPVPDRRGLLFLTVLGVGVVAIVVDLLTVGLRRPALAGLPMLAIYSVPVAVYVDSVPAVPFVIGAVGFLWLLVADNVERVRRFGRRFTGDGRDVDVWEPSPLAAAGRRLTVVGVAAAVLLPLAVPGMTSGLLAQVTQGAGGEGVGGQGRGTGQVKLFAGLSGGLNQSKTTEMIRVSTNEPEPFYLRFGVADVLDEEGFSNRAPTRGQSITRGLPDPRDAVRPGVTQRQFRARVEVTGDFDMPMAPTYAAPVRIDDLDSSWFYDPLMQVVHSSRSRTRDKAYEFDYVVSSYSQAALRSVEPLAATNPLRRQFTTFPQVPAVNARVAELTRGAATEYDKVRAIYDSFSRENGFTYSLQTTGGTSGSEIVSFLTSKVGFCQQYAAAMAWMVRVAGIPARVAFGFTRGVKQPDNRYVLTNRNLHAWTEVYFDGLGWVPFDATPPIVGSSRSAWAPDTDRAQPVNPTTNPSATATNNPSAGPDTPDNRANEDDLGAPGAGGSSGPQATGFGRWLAVTGGVLVAALLLLVPALRRVLIRRRRRNAVAAAPPAPPGGAPGDPTGAPTVVLRGATAIRAREDAHAAWDELIDTMVDFRLPVDPAETPRLTAHRLTTASQLSGSAAQGAALLGRAEERARYAREPMQAERLGAALHEVRGALAGRAGRRVRFMAAVLPPSVLRRWRLGLSDAVSSIVAATTRRSAAMSRFNPLSRWNPRRLLAGRSSR